MPPKNKKRRKNKVVVGHNEDGSPIVKWASGWTKKELAQNLEQVKQEYTGVARDVERDAVFRVYAQRYYDAYRRDRVSASQRVNIASALNNHILPYIGDKQVRAISAMDLQDVMNRLSGRSKTLVGDVHTVLRSTFSHAYASGVVDRDPTVGIVLPTTRKIDHRRALTDDESSAVLEVGASHPYGLLLLMLYFLGLRRGEALGCRWEDVDFSRVELHVERDIDFTVNGIDGLKSKAAKRVIPIPDELLAFLRPLRGVPGAYVLQSPTGGFWSSGTYRLRWDALRMALLDAAPGVERKILIAETNKLQKIEDRLAEHERRKPRSVPPVYGSALTAHFLRHNYASILYDNDVDVLTAQKLLGHSDPKTTLSIYTHLKESRESTDREIIQSAFTRERSILYEKKRK